MKITNVSVEKFIWPREKPITNGLHTYTHASLGLVNIETDEGISGTGLMSSFAAGGGTGEVETATVEHLTPKLIGEDPIDVERIWHKIWIPKTIGRRGYTTRAISAIDIGLWDIRAKAAGMPLFKMLGGYRDRVPTYVAGGYYVPGKDLSGLADEMVEYVEMGAKAVKMKVGAVPINEDVARVKAAREAVGPDVKLLLDANCAYRYYEAVQFAKRVEEFDIFWFEEPVPPDDYEGYRKLAQQTSIPLAGGENEYTKFGFRDLIKEEAVAVLNADAKHLGGVTEFMKVAALAQAHHIDIAPHGSQDIHVHLVAAIENGLILEFYPQRFDPMWGKIYKETLTINDDGTVSPPTVPGIGVDPDYEFLKQYRVE
ncbi:MAG TPA: mandelate racemase/muconate lactonizing enzyme family protein [Rhodospirillaceae bacterium]|nr:mandelate racemase [Rhodospirillaceae bacterium]HAA92726.1 mandelate racemase/muconate lactonizing enzyme family protein [Rhodospirillaceae bacterium]HAT34639.1 mandelate racemase/muconate lactonizing enzyme family protein [Rhodospirillaceae bacterium]